jgi:hypothetical protein
MRSKAGVNYLKYYGGKTVNSDMTRDQLNEDNAEDIYDGQSLKGSALVAQMLSMDKVFLQAYVLVISVFSSAIICSIVGFKNIQNSLSKTPYMKC